MDERNTIHILKMIILCVITLLGRPMRFIIDGRVGEDSCRLASEVGLGGPLSDIAFSSSLRGSCRGEGNGVYFG